MKLLESKLKFIKLVGLEMEGGWLTPPTDKYTIIHDHSVCSGRKDAAGVTWPFMMSGDFQCRHVGEKVSEAMTLAKSLKWLEDHFPDASNGSCGFHVHVSVRNPEMYRLLTKKKFWKCFLLEAEVFGKELGLPENHQFWWRLRGENRFCYKKFRPIEQMTLTTKPQNGPQRDLRRCMLNYCWNMHGTLECRLFPMWENVSLAKASVNWFVKLVERFLAKEKVKLKSLRRRVVISEDRCKREKVEESPALKSIFGFPFFPVQSPPALPHTPWANIVWDGGPPEENSYTQGEENI